VGRATSGTGGLQQFGYCAPGTTCRGLKGSELRSAATRRSMTRPPSAWHYFEHLRDPTQAGAPRPLSGGKVQRRMAANEGRAAALGRARAALVPQLKTVNPTAATTRITTATIA
jgi:hypothetical protein